jgi:hypothetical protein
MLANAVKKASFNMPIYIEPGRDSQKRNLQELSFSN